MSAAADTPPPLALCGARIFDGERWHDDAALVLAEGRVEGLLPLGEVGADAKREDLEGGILAPGFVDLQVNGGGGIMLNDEQSAEAVARICRAHARFGTTALLATLITDTPEITARAVAAAQEAERAGVPGFLGLHLEGPHLSRARKGTHDPALIRPMELADLEKLAAAKEGLRFLLTTVAPESVSPAQIRRLVQAGITVSLGHTDLGLAAMEQAAEAGAGAVTHLFNAMSQLGSREPGLVGAALECGAFSAGLIADGIHVDPTSIRIALRAKKGPGRIFLVTDAMATIGTDMTGFTLNGRAVFRKDGRLTLADGTLAGADLDMASAVRFIVERIGVELGEALRMASLYPAEAIGAAPSHGKLLPGSRADIVHLTDGLMVRRTWIEGNDVGP